MFFVGQHWAFGDSSWLLKPVAHHKILYDLGIQQPFVPYAIMSTVVILLHNLDGSIYRPRTADEAIGPLTFPLLAFS